MKNLIQSVLILNALLLSTKGAEVVTYAQVGETITLNPPEMNSQKYLYWYFGELELAWRNNHGSTWFINDKKKWNSSLSLSSDSLVVKNIRQEQFGIFVGKMATFPAGEMNVVTITYKVLKLNVNTPSPLLPGESLSLNCDTENPQGYKKPKIHWLNPKGEKVNNQGSFTVAATGQHNGQWTCVVTNDNIENKAKISVTVVDLSPAPPHPQYTSKSSPLTIPCSIPAHISWEQIKAKGIKEGSWHFYPKTDSSSISDKPQRLFSLSVENSVTWNKDQDRELTGVRALEAGNLTLTRNRGRDTDSGNYVCTLKFKNDVTLSRTVHVEVLQIRSSPGTDLISGQQVNLTCGLGHPLPSDLRIKWFPPQQSSRSSLTSDHHSTHLIIPEVGTEDGGTWKCGLMHNNTQLTSAVITLKIEPKLSVWMLVVICSVTVIVILLLVLVFILCRRRQRKMKHLRHRLCHCQNPKPKGFYRT